MRTGVAIQTSNYDRDNSKKIHFTFNYLCGIICIKLIDYELVIINNQPEMRVPLG